MLAYIPARGGSKRLPGKNIRPLDGIPVIARVIAALKGCSFISAVCVSTDEPRVANVAHDAGAEVLEPRAAKLADDHASFMDLLRDDLPRFFKHFGVNPQG